MEKSLVVEAVKNRGSALLHATFELRASKEIALTAVTNYGPALRYCSLALQGDLDVALTAVGQNMEALSSVSEALLTGGLLIHVENIVAAHRTFTNCFLVAATHGRRNSSEAAHVAKLRKLGDDAGLCFVRQVAEYAGITYGPSVAIARRVKRGPIDRNTIRIQHT